MTSSATDHEGPRRRTRLSLLVPATAIVITAAIALGVSVASSANADSPARHDVEVRGDCPAVGDAISSTYLSDNDLENPSLSPTLVDTVEVRAITCRRDERGVIGLDLYLASPGEAMDKWSAIYLGPRDTSRYVPSDVIDVVEARQDAYASSEALEHSHDEAVLGDEIQPKPHFVRHQIGESSILAVDPTSQLSDRTLAEPDGKTTIADLRWSR